MLTRIMVIADIHANLAALEAVSADAEGRGPLDEIWCLGDLVGYGPDPGECLRFLKEKCSICVAGNHDLAAAGIIDTAGFNTYAAAAINWTRTKLSQEDRNYLGNLPLFVEREDFTLVHGSPRDPVNEYLSSTDEAMHSFHIFRTRYCLAGHTHRPTAFTRKTASSPQVSRLRHQDVITLADDKLIINPGAVGQPRDNDPRASYGVIDFTRHQFTLHRVAYDIEPVQKRMQEQKLPVWLIERLKDGC